MDNVARYRSMEAFCRHRARVEVEESDTWLKQASIFSNMAAAESERQTVAETTEEISHSGDR
jgi:hypothetical protein